MGNVLVKEETLTQIAEAIREKAGTDDLYKPGEMPKAILDISTFSEEGADPSKPVRFYGPYGDLVYSFRVEELNKMTELPILPEYQGLVGQTWNWSLENAKAVNGEIEIGSLYVTDNGETRIYIELVEEALNPKVGFKQNFANAVWIDWGDGKAMSSSEVYGNEVVSIEHEYDQPGSYVICLVPEEDAEITLVGNGGGTLLLHQRPENTTDNMRYANSIQKIELGTAILKFTNSCFKSETLKSITIPNTITKFDGAFSGCISLETITFPQGISSLGNSEFSGCYGLKKVLFPDRRISMYTGTFKHCQSLEEIVFSSYWSNYSSDFSDCYNLKRAVLPPKMEQINGSMFSGCTLLKEVVIRGTVTKILSDAFRGCYSLEKIELPDSITQIGTYSFYGCYLIRHLKLPNSLVSIGNSAFGNCHSLKKVEIPESVTTIDNQAFLSCYSVKEYYIYPVNPPVLGGSNVFYVANDCKMYVPKGSLEAYQTAEYWNEYADYMVEMEE